VPNGPGHDFWCTDFSRRSPSIVAQVEMSDDTLLNSRLEYALEPGEMARKSRLAKANGWVGC